VLNVGKLAGLAAGSTVNLDSLEARWAWCTSPKHPSSCSGSDLGRRLTVQAPLVSPQLPREKIEAGWWQL